MDREANRIQLLEQQPWEEIILGLDKYALQKARRLYWPTASGRLDILAKGASPTDIAREAIARLFEGTRDWDPDKEPDVLRYLKSVVDSLMSALVESAEVAEVRVSVAYDETDASTVISPSQASVVVESTALHPAPLSPELVAQENELRERILAAVAGDEFLELLVLCLAEGHTKRSDIARELGVSADEVTNLRRRLQRVVDCDVLGVTGKGRRE
ncbi:MAG: hypothetical protein AMXMBFR82_06860 [Candidatus Hydrogenedentota bacterium]